MVDDVSLWNEKESEVQKLILVQQKWYQNVSAAF